MKFLFAALLIVCQQGAAAQLSWPNGARAAVSLGYDDALDSQLDTAIPALNARGLKASFYLTLSSPVVRQRMDTWRAAAAAGHELGNHTLFHQCARSGPDRAWVSLERDLDTTSPAQLVDQIRLGNTLLHAIDGRTSRTFAAPCGELLASGLPYLPLLAHDFVGLRTRIGDGIEALATLNPQFVNVTTPSGVSGAQLIAMVQRAAERGGLISITFHGIGGDHLQVSPQAHAALLDYLASNKALYWTDTFLNIMQYVKK